MARFVRMPVLARDRPRGRAAAAPREGWLPFLPRVPARAGNGPIVHMGWNVLSMRRGRLPDAGLRHRRQLHCDNMRGLRGRRRRTGDCSRDVQTGFFRLASLVRRCVYRRIDHADAGRRLTPRRRSGKQGPEAAGGADGGAKNPAREAPTGAVGATQDTALEARRQAVRPRGRLMTSSESKAPEDRALGALGQGARRAGSALFHGAPPDLLPSASGLRGYPPLETPAVGVRASVNTGAGQGSGEPVPGVAPDVRGSRAALESPSGPTS